MTMKRLAGTRMTMIFYCVLVLVLVVVVVVSSSGCILVIISIIIIILATREYLLELNILYVFLLLTLLPAASYPTCLIEVRHKRRKVAKFSPYLVSKIFELAVS